MNNVLLTAMMVTCFSAFISLIRFIKGPTSCDRVVASDTLSTHVVALLILYCMRTESAVYYDAVLVLTILGFVGTLTFAKYLVGHGNILDYEQHD